MKITSLIVVVASLIFGGTASASPVLWTATGAWGDGGTLSGTFEFDASTNTYSNVSLTTTAGADVNPGTTYSSCAFVTNVFGDCTRQVDNVGVFNITVFYDLQLRFTSPLTDAAGNVAFLSGSLLGTAEIVREFHPDGPLIGDRFLPSTAVGGVSGVAVGRVPEPLSLSIFGAGLAGAAALRRRKKKSA